MSTDDDKDHDKDDDRELLAAEYALGTLNALDRANVEMLMAIDPAFVVGVRVWERRLGVLDALVAPVEPPAAVWTAIKAQIEKQAPSGPFWLPAVDGSSAIAPAPPTIEFAPEPSIPVGPGAAADVPSLAVEPEFASLIGRPADVAESSEPPIASERGPFGPLPQSANNVVSLSGRLRAWRQLAIAASAAAALLLAFVSLRDLRPDLLPATMRPRTVEIVRTIEMPSQKMADFVAVFQNDDQSPAFLLSVDAEHRALSVRRVGAKTEAGKSYELWIIPTETSAPRSLGLVGDEEFTVRRSLDGYNPLTLAAATFAVSLEPEGGSPTGRPTGKALHGKLIETAPPAFPAVTP